jgi:hypothetical protein
VRRHSLFSRTLSENPQLSQMVRSAKIYWSHHRAVIHHRLAAMLWKLDCLEEITILGDCNCHRSHEWISQTQPLESCGACNDFRGPKLDHLRKISIIDYPVAISQIYLFMALPNIESITITQYGPHDVEIGEDFEESFGTSSVKKLDLCCPFVPVIGLTEHDQALRDAIKHASDWVTLNDILKRTRRLRKLEYVADSNMTALTRGNNELVALHPQLAFLEVLKIHDDRGPFCEKYIVSLSGLKFLKKLEIGARFLIPSRRKLYARNEIWKLLPTSLENLEVWRTQL